MNTCEHCRVQIRGKTHLCTREDLKETIERLERDLAIAQTALQDARPSMGRLALLKEALQPFAAFSFAIKFAANDSDVVVRDGDLFITVGAIRRAHDAYSGKIRAD